MRIWYLLFLLISASSFCADSSKEEFFGALKTIRLAAHGLTHDRKNNIEVALNSALILSKLCEPEDTSAAESTAPHQLSNALVAIQAFIQQQPCDVTYATEIDTTLREALGVFLPANRQPNAIERLKKRMRDGSFYGQDKVVCPTVDNKLLSSSSSSSSLASSSKEISTSSSDVSTSSGISLTNSLFSGPSLSVPVSNPIPHDLLTAYEIFAKHERHPKGKGTLLSHYSNLIALTRNIMRRLDPYYEPSRPRGTYGSDVCLEKSRNYAIDLLLKGVDAASRTLRDPISDLRSTVDLRIKALRAAVVAEKASTLNRFLIPMTQEGLQSFVSVQPSVPQSSASLISTPLPKKPTQRNAKRSRESISRPVPPQGRLEYLFAQAQAKQQAQSEGLEQNQKEQPDTQSNKFQRTK